MLTLKNIDIWFGNNHVLRNLSCSVERGDFVVIVGTNGAGKSTFFDTIAGKVPPKRGSITLDGTDITHQNELQRAGYITRIFQNTRLNSVSSMTVMQNLAFAYFSRRPATLARGMHNMPREKAAQLLKDVGMSPALLDTPMNALSGGQRQLIAFVMCTRLLPKVLLLDEPTAALDPQAATRLLHHAAKFIKKHHLTTLLITHDPHIALSIGNKIWVLENGTISRTYDKRDKAHLSPEKLIGSIDYALIAQNN